MRSRRPSPVHVVWAAAIAALAAALLLQVAVRPLLADDPRVGAGRLYAPGVAPEPAPVLPALAAPGEALDAAALARRIAAVPRDGVTDTVALVVDAATGAELYRQGSGARTPASSLKLLTSAVALDVLGPTRRFATRAVLDGGTLTLIGGGDPLLASVPSARFPERASLQELARAAASALTVRGMTSVSLRYDASLFGEPAWNPDWPAVFATSVAPITAVTTDHARLNPAGEDFARHPDPSLLAAERFAEQLSHAGITVSAVEPGTAPAVSGATEIARVESPPVAGIVASVLAESDNDAAETLLWQVALERGLPATPSGGARALRTELTRLGLWSGAMAVVDGNGIATANRVSVDALVGAVRLGLDDPAFRALAQGLPVAGVTGTLLERFEGADAVAGRGVVRAKTGTIRGVNTLAGYVVTRDGHPLAFALMTSDAGQDAARAWLDGVSSALASCGC